jgi:hypothetical protein
VNADLVVLVQIGLRGKKREEIGSITLIRLRRWRFSKSLSSSFFFFSLCGQVTNDVFSLL